MGIIRFKVVYFWLGFGILASGWQVVPAQVKQGDTEMESGFITVDNGRLFYEKTGQGDPFVLIHDGLIHSVIWDYFFENWADHNTLVRYDRRGYGKSPTPTETYSNTADLLAIFDSLGIEKATLMGGSAGGGLAIDFTLEHPERVTHLVLVGAVVSGMGYSDHFITRGGRLTPEIYGDQERFVMYLVTGDPYEVYEGNAKANELARAIMAANQHNMNRVNNRLAAPPRRPALPSLSEIKVPTLIIVGDHDHPDVHAHAGAIEAGIPGARRVILSDCGHLVPLEQPEALADAVATFLDEAHFFAALDRGGVEAAVTLYHARRKQDPGATLFTESRLNSVGYQYLLGGDAPAAVALFRLIIDAYPQSANAFDSYAEGLLVTGDTTGAVSNYEKSLTLNPNNSNAVAVLERLRKTH